MEMRSSVETETVTDRWVKYSTVRLHRTHLCPVPRTTRAPRDAAARTAPTALGSSKLRARETKRVGQSKGTHAIERNVETDERPVNDAVVDPERPVNDAVVAVHSSHGTHLPSWNATFDS